MTSLRADQDYGIKDGMLFSDYFAEKLLKLTKEVGLDGVAFADGLTGSVYGFGALKKALISLYEKGTFWYGFREGEFFDLFANTYYVIESGDFSDRFLDMFEDQYKIEIPGNTVKEKANHILARHQKEWIEFNQTQWKRFFQHVHARMSPINKKIWSWDCFSYSPLFAAQLCGFDYASLNGLVDYFMVQTFEEAKGFFFHIDPRFWKHTMAKTRYKSVRSY